MTTDPKFSRLTTVSFALFIAVAFLSPTVRSSSPDFNPLRLPSDLDNIDSGDDSRICPRSATEESDSCPVKCFRTNPVCGVDGVTYWCGCADAHCAGTRVAKMGFCEVGNGGAGPVTGQALLLVHIIWLILLGIFVVFGLL